MTDEDWNDNASIISTTVFCIKGDVDNYGRCKYRVVS